MRRSAGSDIVQELATDYLWKAGIVLVLAVVSVVAMVMIWRRTGAPEKRKDRDAEDR